MAWKPQKWALGSIKQSCDGMSGLIFEQPNVCQLKEEVPLIKKKKRVSAFYPYIRQNKGYMDY